uniref:G_PROTEIN_RECEP_F1_2 domain-containing protein n=1 Tax=Strongyloides papillosus TaxID=174720 RepID=A0A0N5BQR9_STREA
MDPSMVPTYIRPYFGISGYQVSIISLLSIPLNIYFFYRCLTYSKFKERKFFKYMIMIMSLEYICASIFHLIFYLYISIHYYTNSQVNVKTCSKLESIHYGSNQILNMTLLYLNIIRFYKIVYNEKPNIIVMGLTVLITMGPFLYLLIGKFFEINIYFVPRQGCGYSIYSKLPFYKYITYGSILMNLIYSSLSLIINYVIYRIVVKKTSVSNKAKINDNKSVFWSVAIQSLFPFCYQVPATIYYFVFLILQGKKVTEIEIFLNLLFYSGHLLSIFLSLVVIKHFKIMMLNDFGCKSITDSIPITQVRAKSMFL